MMMDDATNAISDSAIHDDDNSSGNNNDNGVNNYNNYQWRQQQHHEAIEESSSHKLVDAVEEQHCVSLVPHSCFNNVTNSNNDDLDDIELDQANDEEARQARVTPTIGDIHHRDDDRIADESNTTNTNTNNTEEGGMQVEALVNDSTTTSTNNDANEKTIHLNRQSPSSTRPQQQQQQLLRSSAAAPPVVPRKHNVVKMKSTTINNFTSSSSSDNRNPGLKNLAGYTGNKSGSSSSSSSSSSNLPTIRGRVYRSSTAIHQTPGSTAAPSCSSGGGGALTGVILPSSTATTKMPSTTTTAASNSTLIPINNNIGGGNGASSSSSSTRWVTRELAALDFLLGIAMESETGIVREGLNARLNARRRAAKDGGNFVNISSDEENDEELYAVEDLDVDDDLIDQGDIVDAIVAEDDLERGTASPAVPRRRTSALKKKQQQGLPTPNSRWWEKLLNKDSKALASVTEEQNARKARRARLELEEKELELPTTTGTARSSAVHAVNSGRNGTGGTDDGVFRRSHGTTNTTATKVSLTTNNVNNNKVEIGRSLLSQHQQQLHQHHHHHHVAPGRRLDGRQAILIAIPKAIRLNERSSNSSSSITNSNAPPPPTPPQHAKQIIMGRSVAMNAAVREWEIRVAHGIGELKSLTATTTNSIKKVKTEHNNNTNNDNGDVDNNENRRGMLDGRMFFSSQAGYPVAVFSIKRYEPKKEEAARRRRKLEELGGGARHFAIPPRDWRGISYGALLRTGRYSKSKSKKRAKNKDRKVGMDRALDLIDGAPSSSTASISSSSSSDGEGSDTYKPGFIDDPEMVQGRHRHVMVGDGTNIGPIVSSVIQFVKPEHLRNDLNKQFRDRFDGWEPPKRRRKIIGARIIDGVYTLIDPTDDGNDISNSKDEDSSTGTSAQRNGRRSTSVGSEKELLRIPPSLTLSKIRSLKQQALNFCIRAKFELSTLALSFVYFEQLCLDCRVDKSNRKFTFAACMLLAFKMNEKHVVLNLEPRLTRRSGGKEDKKGTVQDVLSSFARPNLKSMNRFSSLLEFFANDWEISLEHLFQAEWGVFAALGFKLQVAPSQVAFHFRLILKVLERNPYRYLGQEMYDQWQACLVDELIRKERHAKRKESRREKNEYKLLKLQRELQLKKQGSGRSERRPSLTNSTSEAAKDFDSDDKSAHNNAPQSKSGEEAEDDRSARLSTGSSPKRSSLRVWNRLMTRKSGNGANSHRKSLENSPTLTQPNMRSRTSSVGRDMNTIENNLPGLRRSISSPHLSDEIIFQPEFRPIRNDSAMRIGLGDKARNLEGLGNQPASKLKSAKRSEDGIERVYSMV